MDGREQQIRRILDHISRIETELTLLQELIGQFANNSEEEDQDLILVDTELVVPQNTVTPSTQVPQESSTITSREARTLTRREILQEARWRAQNWAIRERQDRSEREALEQLRRATQEDRA